MISKLTFRKFFNVLLIAFLIIKLSSCASILIPNSQTVTINTGNKDSKVFIDNEKFGSGKSITGKVTKSGVKQVVIQTPGYKDNYYALVPIKVVDARPPLTLLSFAFFFYPGFVDLMATGPKFHAYAKDIQMQPTNKLINRESDEKYIHLEAIKLKVADMDKDVRDYYGITHKQKGDVLKEIEKAEKSQADADRKVAAKASASKKKQKETLDQGDKKISYVDTKFSEMIFTTLKQTGYIDTVNKVFPIITIPSTSKV